MISDSSLIAGFVLFAAFLITPNSYTFAVIWQIGLFSFLQCCLSYGLAEIYAYGKAAPSSAISEISSIVTLILEILFMHEYPNKLEAVGYTIGLAGGLLITLGAM